MLLMLLIGWIVLLPAFVVAGLYIGSSVLGRRRAALGTYEDLLADAHDSGADVSAVTPEAITGAMNVAPAVSERAPASVPAAPPVGAGY